MTDDARPVQWPYRSDIPQRYNDNAALYRARGGKVRIEEEARGFAADGDHGDMSRFFAFCLAQDQILKEGLPGDVAELGVYRGATASLLATLARRKGATAWLFDTFAGFRAEDLTGIDADKASAQFTDTSLEAVRARVGEDAVRYVPGYFPRSAADLPDDLRFCLVHIDCDLYEPITAGLRYFYPRLVPGGFLVMHDYTSLAWNGAERAIDAFFADKPESPIPMPDGAGSAIIRRARDPARDPHWTRPPGLPIGEIAPAGHGGLARHLTQGWSGAEDWGVWGIGERHCFELSPDTGPVRLDFDCEACLVGPIAWQYVAVSLDGQTLATWRFTHAENRAVRSVAIPSVPPGAALVFSPAVPMRPMDYDPSSTDDRLLGMALHGVCRRA